MQAIIEEGRGMKGKETRREEKGRRKGTRKVSLKKGERRGSRRKIKGRMGRVLAPLLCLGDYI